jgi:hypothetical protein
MPKPKPTPTPKSEALTLKRKPSPPAPGASLPAPSVATNRALSPIVRLVYESLGLRDPLLAERYLTTHIKSITSNDG